MNQSFQETIVPAPPGPNLNLQLQPYRLGKQFVKNPLGFFSYRRDVTSPFTHQYALLT